MGSNRRNADRVRFESGYHARIMGIDGTWHQQCSVVDISATGAKLMVQGTLDRMRAAEFFLVLSRTGHPHRRCKMAWVNGDTLGVRFVKPSETTKESTKRTP